MRNILYKSDNIIPWDTQSAFKMNSYSVQCEENMIFCYLKAYVHKSDLVLCSYCFTEKPAEYANMHLYLGLGAEKSSDKICIDYGYSGIENMPEDMKTAAGAEFRSFRADDEQGFYWCGEIRIKGEYISLLSGNFLQERSILTINLTQSFDNGDMAALFGDVSAKGYNREAEAETFVVLNY